jgi:tripartite-type tricarboxylate transporter receptor subunit TctC
VKKSKKGERAMQRFMMLWINIFAAAVGSAIFCVPLALAEEFPVRPITMIVQFAPGTSTDIVARKLADEVSKTLGQPVVCVNKPGGGGTVGVAEMLRSKPDGYTIGCVNMPVLGIIPHMQGVPYDPLKDVAHICVVQPYEYGLYVKADAPWNTLKELVEYIKSHPGEVIFGSIGIGTTNHLIMNRIAKQEHLKFKHVPYKGDGELIPAMIGGHVHAAVGSPSAVVPQVKAGNLKLLTVTSKDRWSYLPEVPTLFVGRSGRHSGTGEIENRSCLPQSTPGPNDGGRGGEQTICQVGLLIRTGIRRVHSGAIRLLQNVPQGRRAREVT